MDKHPHKICFICPSLRKGGLERVISILSEYFINNFNFDVSIILISNKSIEYEINERINIYTPDWFKKDVLTITHFFKLIRYLRKTIKLINPTSIISMSERYNSFVIFSLFFINIPIYISNRASPVSSLKGFRGFVNPLFYPFSKGLIVQTDSAMKLLKDRYRFSKFIKIGNPFNMMDSPDIISREKIILNVGYLGGQKNQISLIDYFSQLKNKDGWKLYLVGDGPDRRKIKTKIDTLNLSGSIKLLGNRDDIFDLMKKSQIFAFTSFSEGFPNVLGEAMSLGMACISYDIISGPSELIKSHENGILIQDKNHDAYIRNLQKLINTEDLRIKLSRNAIIAMEKYKTSKIANIYKESLLNLK